jgi:hypothetical protein
MWITKKYACGCEVRLPGNPTPAQFDAMHNKSHSTQEKSFVPVREKNFEADVDAFLKSLVVSA